MQLNEPISPSQSPGYGDGADPLEAAQSILRRGQSTSPEIKLHAILTALSEKPYKFDFFHAVRMMECVRTDLPRVGLSISPSEDPVRFWQKPSLRFAPSAIDSVEGPSSAPRMAVNFFGLFGPNAPMPPHITEYALEREMPPNKDATITAFFNIFHHR